MDKKTFLALLSKEIAGTLSPKENQELNQILSENAYYKSIYDEFHYFMNQKPHEEVDLEAKLKDVWERMEDEQLSPATSSKKIIPFWMKIAAGILLMVGMGWMITQWGNKKENIFTETIESGNNRSFFVLQDGTQVWLNANSKLSYNADFGKNKREIQLEGEAFFDVTHNPAVPLTVHSQEVDVTVKGTAFNVNSYEKGEVEVALLRGSVAVKSEKEKGVTLVPNQKVVMKDGKLYNLSTIEESKKKGNDSIATIAVDAKWTNGELTFTKQRLADIAKLMESRYHVSVIINSASLKEQRFTGVINNESLTEMLDALKLSYPFLYEIVGKTVTINKNH